MRTTMILCSLLLFYSDIANAQNNNTWGFYEKLVGITQQHETGDYRIRWKWAQPNVELLEEYLYKDRDKIFDTRKFTIDSQNQIRLDRRRAIWLGTQQADGSFLFIGQGWGYEPLQTLLDPQNHYRFRAVKLNKDQTVRIQKEFRHVPIGESQPIKAEITPKNQIPVESNTQPKNSITPATEQQIIEATKSTIAITKNTTPSTPRTLSAHELEKLHTNVQKSKANAKANEENRRQEEERRRQELAAYDAWLEQDVAARRPTQQNIASVFMNTFNNEIQKNQANQAAFDARIANTIQVAQLQKQKEAQARQAQQQRQREIQARQTQNAQPNIASPQIAQSRDQALREAAAVERQRLQQVEQQRKEAEQKQLAIAQKQEEEKRQKVVEQKQQAELKQREAANYASAIRAGTRVGAISCGSGQRTHIVGVLGRAQRPKSVYNDCRLEEVRYRCPSESGWQYRSHNLWQLNNACIGVGDDVVVSANCPAEQLIVQTTKFSCDVK